MVEVPDGTAVSLSVYTVDEVSVSDQVMGIISGTPDGSGTVLAVPPWRKSRDKVSWRVTWKRGMRRNTRSIWGEGSYSVGKGEEAVDLGFVRSLPPDSVDDLSVGNVTPDSSPRPGIWRQDCGGFGLYIDNLGNDAPSVLEELRALESLALCADQDGRGQLDDHALSMIADLPALDTWHSSTGHTPSRACGNWSACRSCGTCT